MLYFEDNEKIFDANSFEKENYAVQQQQQKKRAHN